MKKINAELRTVIGKSSKKLIATNQIPASVYGPGFTPINISIKATDLKAILSSTSSELFELNVDNKLYTTLIKEIQKHPFNDKVFSISFYNIDQNTELTADIPLTITGVSMAVKNNLGFMVTPVDHIKVRCLANALPDKLVIDISKLDNVGESILINQVQLPAGVKLHSSVNPFDAIVSIVPPQKEEKTVVATDVAATTPATDTKAAPAKDTKK